MFEQLCHKNLGILTQWGINIGLYLKNNLRILWRQIDLVMGGRKVLESHHEVDEWGRVLVQCMVDPPSDFPYLHNNLSISNFHATLLNFLFLWVSAPFYFYVFWIYSFSIQSSESNIESPPKFQCVHIKLKFCIHICPICLGFTPVGVSSRAPQSIFGNTWLWSNALRRNN